jgi:quercetin dioxygenase-like cupin family protein
VPKIDNFKRLEELTKELIDWGENVVEYEVEAGAGAARSKSLLNDPRVCVANTMLEKGTIFPEHVHNAIEHVIVYTGEIKAEVDNETCFVKAGSAITIEKGKPHTVTALERTLMVAIVIPHDKGYPGNGQW